MRKFRFVDGLDDNWQPIIETWTEQKVLDFYWQYWSSKMREMRPEMWNATSLDDLKETCLQDWEIVYGAEEV